MKKSKHSEYVYTSPKRTAYWTDGKGRWWKRDFPAQCPVIMLVSRSCQGIKGHEGDHWCYREDGSYQWAANRKENKKPFIAGGSIPPGHKKYIDPIKKQKDHYVSYASEWIEITNKQLIVRLEKGEIKPNESINQPVDID